MKINKITFFSVYLMKNSQKKNSKLFKFVTGSGQNLFKEKCD